jgi:hypothetical protein
MDLTQSQAEVVTEEGECGDGRLGEAQLCGVPVHDEVPSKAF